MPERMTPAEVFIHEALNDLRNGLDPIPRLEAAIAAVRADEGGASAIDAGELSELAEDYVGDDPPYA